MYDRKDALHQRAKREGYRSRAAYKLLELQKRGRVLRRGQVVVDLGAWPGGWLQVAAEVVGPSGRVVGIDLAQIDPLPAPQIVVVRDDVTDPSCTIRLAELLGRKADLILSDLAPKLTGIGPRDAAQAATLAEATRSFAKSLLGPGGTLVTKTLGGQEGELARAALKELFASVRQVGLDSTRKGSSELYLLATGFQRKRTD
ncbi:MAG: ribosomal methyltransferase RrmJ/FtsJ [Deltaproteobacteria bacterium]|nr:ribosomal methyltransferase RrmJ/FtsJ [Deltaproteobacteria bacterium]